MKGAFYVNILIALQLLSACTSTKYEKTSTIQIPNNSWWSNLSATTKIESSDDQTILLEITPDTKKNLVLVRNRMAGVSPIKFILGFSGEEAINAYSSLQNGQSLTIFTGGFIKEFGRDPDVLANVLGHELGHHQLRHTQPDYAKNRNLAISVTSQALGMAASYFIPFSGLLVGPAVKGAGLSYNRDDERDADNFGMNLATAAGYSPCGSYRFAYKTKELGQGTFLAFLSTHPG